MPSRPGPDACGIHARHRAAARPQPRRPAACRHWRTRTDGAAPRAVLLFGRRVPASNAWWRARSTTAGHVARTAPAATAPTIRCNFDTAGRIAAGELDAARSLHAWRAALPARGRRKARPIDWLLWWDNALLHASGRNCPTRCCCWSLADPRDMLLDWLQRAPYAASPSNRLPRPLHWLARRSRSARDPDRRRPVPASRTAHRRDRGRCRRACGRRWRSTGTRDAAAARARAGYAIPSGHWRHYREALAEPFALLTPVAQRLGYPET